MNQAVLTIRLGHALSKLMASLHNGPGRRVCLWVQGCSLRCTTDCLSPHLLSPSGGHELPIDDVIGAVLEIARRDGAEGITVLGGEPTDQAEALVPLLEAAQAAGLSTMVYSGHVLGTLRRSLSPAMARLLAATDLLVDGPFVPDRYDEHLAWRGSSNQRIRRLSKRYRERDLSDAYQRQAKSFSITVDPDGSISCEGLQSRATARYVECWMEGRAGTDGPTTTLGRKP